MYSHGQTTDVKIDIYEIMPVKKKKFEIMVTI